ncbi:uncharacterized protein LOC120627500 [Pararge aegeria]|uniref:Jg20909 protein n=3 Tax=Pararge aegeria TaxID=116150 RepID=A0A8S4RHR2_9NEOP|nr:uncharacterized protein LOC120627500 [Pararge aegeria]CAH2236691.1 jg20909 [Pararge aegeria aegeria]
MPKAVKSAKRQAIIEVYAFCEREKTQKNLIIPLAQVRARVAAMTNVSEATVTRILRQERDNSSFCKPGPSRVPTPGKKRPNRAMNINLDQFDLCAIRHKIMSFYSVRKEIPTLNKLLVELRKEINFEGGRTTLWKILKRLGYKYKSGQSNRKVLIERTDIAAWRFNYLNQIKEYRAEGRTIVYLDETFIYSLKGAKVSETSEFEDGVLITDTGTAKRWIIAHAGTAQGFINNALLLFKSQTKLSDYHGDMNSVKFIDWLENQVLPNLLPNCVIVMDNEPYHTIQINKVPNMSSSKTDMIEWLYNKGLPFSPNVSKTVLYKLIKENKPEPLYKADELLKAHGHIVLRLPPHHADLNPLELIWGVMKRQLAEKKVGQTDGQVESLIKETFDTVNDDLWEEKCSLVIKTEEDYREKDKIIDEASDNFMSWVSSGSEESDSDSELSSNNEDSHNMIPRHLFDHTYLPKEALS